MFGATLVIALTATSVGRAAPAAPPARSAADLMALYHNFSSAGLDPQKVFRIADGSLDEEDIHLSLDDGTIAFTRAVDGRVTGAFFQGDGEILLLPPDQAERASISLFTGQAVLEERFFTAYFRFNSDEAARLDPYLRERPEDADAFIQKWEAIATSLAQTDALGLLRATADEAPVHEKIFHARLGGARLGTFDVEMDTALKEDISIAQTGYAEDGSEYYDVWTAFPMRSVRNGAAPPDEALFTTPNYKIHAQILPSRELDGQAELAFDWQGPPEQVLIFELSRYLKVSEVSLNSAPLSFIQNEAIRGSELARRGNDLMAIVLPAPLARGQHVDLKFTYAGSVISDAGGGLMYVGARGAWYPNRGPEMSNFELEFRVPSQWTVVATGKRASVRNENGEQISRWVSERPLPLAGFNLGQYVTSQETAGPVEVATYAARGVEATLAKKAEPQPIITQPAGPRLPPFLEPKVPEAAPQFALAVDLKPVETRAAQTVEFFAKALGPYPYSSLSITQMPGPNSQGWPGLIFLSSRSFLKPGEFGEPRTKAAEFERALYQQLMPEHEIAHQWWGDSVLWESYRDQWLMEALANYCALLNIEGEDPTEFRLIMERYREDLLATSHGRPYRDAGPVTLGVRLSSSKFPDGYEKIAYERGTWLIHMLRGILADPSSPELSSARFLQILSEIHQQYFGRSLSTQQFQQELEKRLPADVRYEKKASLDWFFDGWVNGTAIPKFGIKDLRIVERAGHLFASGTLNQEDAPKDLVTLVSLYSVSANLAAKPVFLERIFADGDETSFRIRVPAGTKRLAIDPHSVILRQP